MVPDEPFSRCDLSVIVSVRDTHPHWAVYRERDTRPVLTVSGEAGTITYTTRGIPRST